MKLLCSQKHCSKTVSLKNPETALPTAPLWCHIVDRVLSPFLSTSLELGSTYLLLPCLQFFTWSPCTSRPWGSGWPEPRKVTAGPVPLPDCIRVVSSLLTLLYMGKNTWKFSSAAILCFRVSLYLFLSSISTTLFRFCLWYPLFKRLC